MAAAVETRPKARPRITGASLAVLWVLVLVLFVMGAMMVSGFRFLIVRSGSMEPAIGTGDIAVVKAVRPSEVGAGDVVTFRDPSRRGRLVTHRVEDVTWSSGRYDFVTKGDANTGRERWSVGAGGSIGVVRWVIPEVGYPLHWLGSAPVRIALLAGGSLLVGGALLRRIWRG